MRYDDLRERLTLGLAFTSALVVMASTLASAALPPTFVAQQQDRAVRAYCVEWRKTQGKQPLSADQMNKQVVTRLERRYPEVFPECRADHQGRCMSWISALVEGLRRYGQHSLHEVCSNLQAEGAVSNRGSSSSGSPNKCVLCCRNTSRLPIDPASIHHRKGLKSLNRSWRFCDDSEPANRDGHPNMASARPNKTGRCPTLHHQDTSEPCSSRFGEEVAQPALS